MRFKEWYFREFTTAAVAYGTPFGPIPGTHLNAGPTGRSKYQATDDPDARSGYEKIIDKRRPDVAKKVFGAVAFDPKNLPKTLGNHVNSDTDGPPRRRPVPY